MRAGWQPLRYIRTQKALHEARPQHGYLVQAALRSPDGQRHEAGPSGSVTGRRPLSRAARARRKWRNPSVFLRTPQAAMKGRRRAVAPAVRAGPEQQQQQQQYVVGQVADSLWSAAAPAAPLSGLFSAAAAPPVLVSVVSAALPRGSLLPALS